MNLCDKIQSGFYGKNSVSNSARGSWAALAIGGTAAVVGAGSAYLGSQQQQNALQGLAGSYQVPDYDPAIDYLQGQWMTPQFQDYSPVPYTTGYEQFLGTGKYAPRINRMLRGITNRENRQFRQDIDRQTPNFRSSLQQLDRNVASFNRGELPADVAAQVRRNAAYGALTGGFAGSGAARNLEARDFGLTSLNLMDRGAQLLPQVFGLSQGLNPSRASTLQYLQSPGQLQATEIGQQQFANQVYNSNRSQAANFANQRAQMVANLMSRQADANAGGANTNAMLGAQAAASPIPWVSALSTGAGTLASMYGGGFGGGYGASASPQYGGSNYLSGPYGSTYMGQYNNLPVYRPQAA